MPDNNPNILSTRRIAINAVLLYIRTFIVLCISLYLSRLVLAALGAEDLGIYNVVGGIVTLVAFFQAALTKSTGRFITYELGVNSAIEQQKRTFGACLGIHCLITLAIVLFAETIGLWILHHYTVIPSDRLFAAEIAYQLTIVTFSIHFLCIPYSAAIIAHEKMSIYAVLSIVEAVLKLMGVFLIPYLANDSLITYSIVLASVALIIFGTNIFYVLYKMPTYQTPPIWHRETSLRILSFSGWTMLGSTTNTATQQGVALLFNNFVSLIANAALGFANQVNAALGQFVNSFTTAFNPQVIKLCAAQEYNSLHKLMTMASKISFALAYIVALPLITNMEYILQLWLEEVPKYTTEFCQLILVCTVIDATTGVYNTAITATGKIRNYQIAISISFGIDLICAYILLVLNLHPAIVFGSRIMTRGIINMLIGLYYTKSLLSFNITQYLQYAILPIIVVLIVTIPINYILSTHFQTYELLGISIGIDVVLLIVLTYIVILNSKERNILIGIIKEKIHRKK